MAGTRQDGILLVDEVGGGGAPVTITGPLGSQPAAASVSVVLSSDQIPLPVDISGAGPVDVNIVSPLVAGNVNPAYVTDNAIIAALRDVVAFGADALTSPGNRLLPVGTRDRVTNTVRPFTSNSTPWAIDAFGTAALLTRDIGATASQVTGVLDVLNDTLQMEIATNNINAVVVVIADTGAFLGTITPTIAAADGIFIPTTAFKLSDGTPAATLELDTPYVIYTAGLYYFEARVTAYTSGSATGYIVATTCPSVVYGAVNVANTTPIPVSGTISVTEPVTVDAIDLDIRNLVFATDKVDASGSVVDTELPAAVALADNTANPTVPGVGAFGMVYDSAAVNWDRMPGNSVGVTIKPAADALFGSDTIDALNDQLQIFPGQEGFKSLNFRLSPTTFIGTIIFALTNSDMTPSSAFNIGDGKWYSEFIFDASIEDQQFSVPYLASTSGFRIRCTAYTSGSLSVNDIFVSLSPTVCYPLTNAELRSTPLSVNTKTDLTPSAPTVTSVGVASASAVAAAATRKGLILRNLSNARISLGFGSAAVLDSGVTLYPRDTFEMDEFDFDLGQVNAIASAAASSLAIQEYLT